MRFVRVLVVFGALLAGLASARAPGPGETRCTSAPGLFGTRVTNCRSGPTVVQLQGVPQQEPPPQGFWCTQRPDGFGSCGRQPGECEVYRQRNAEAEFQPCTFSAAAICGTSGCYLHPADCAAVEREQDRDGSSCVVAR